MEPLLPTPGWMADQVTDLLQSPDYTVPLTTFIDNRCAPFNSSREHKPEHTAIHKKFKSLVDGVMSQFLDKLGVPMPQFIQMLSKQPPGALNSIVVTSILTVDDFLLFKEMMVHRNMKLQEQEKAVQKKSRKMHVVKASDTMPQGNPLKEREMAQHNDKARAATGDPSPAAALNRLLPKVKKGKPAAPLEEGVQCPLAPEEGKKPGGAEKAKVLKRPQKPRPQKRRSTPVALQPALHNIPPAFPFSYDETPANSRTASRAEILLMSMETAVAHPKPRNLTSPKPPPAEPQGLSALAHDKREPREPTAGGWGGDGCDPVCAGEDGGREFEVCDGRNVEPAAEARFITPKQASLFEDWKPVSQKLDENSDGDQVQQRRRYLQQQRDRVLAQKKALREKQLKYFRRLEGGKKDGEDDNTSAQPGPTDSVRDQGTGEEQDDEVGDDDLKLLYAAGAVWRPISSGSMAVRSSCPTAAAGAPDDPHARPATCQASKFTCNDMVSALTWANQRREARRRELAQRLQEELGQKKRTRLRTLVSTCQCRGCN